MGILIKALAALFGLMAIGSVIYVQHSQLTQANARTEQIQQELNQQQAQMASLHQLSEANQKLLTTLQHKQRQIHTTLSEREKYLDQLIQQKPELRSWAATALPDDIIRLHQHATFSSADDFTERLSTGHSVFAASRCPDNELRTDSNAATSRSSMGGMCGPD